MKRNMAFANDANATVDVVKASKIKRKYSKDEVLTALGCLAPSFILLMLFIVVPLILSIYFSFFDINYYKGNVFVGFANYKKILTGSMSTEFFKSIVVGLKYIAIIVPIQIILSFLIANLIMKLNKRFSSILKVAIYLPCLLSGVVVGAIFSFLYNYDGGLFNSVLQGLGLQKINWTGDKNWAIVSVCIAAIWNGFGYTTLVMLGGLYDIPKDYYEASKMDGANWWKQTIYITIPSLKNIGMYLIVSLMVSAFQLYEIALVIVGSGALHATEGPIYYLYYQFNYSKNMGEVYAASVLIAIILTAISSIIFKFTSSEKSMD